MIIGVDLGIKGAIALLDLNGGLISVHDMPVLDGAGPAGRRAINAPLLAALVFKTDATHAFVETINARPGEGAVGAFSFGRAKGLFEGVLAAAAVPVTFLTSPTWKRIVGIPAGKDGAKDFARAEACRRWPGHAELFARKRDDGRAEAALIAAAGLLRERRP